jgi:hypothetical protein
VQHRLHGQLNGVDGLVLDTCRQAGGGCRRKEVA